MENYTYELVLEHSGVKGMKWGIRRYQNKDGSLTPAGKKRYAQELAKVKAEEAVMKNKAATQAKIDKLNARKQALEDQKNATKGKNNTDDGASTKKSAKDMSNKELQDALDRKKLEDDYNSVFNPKPAPKGQKIVDFALKSVGEKMVMPAVESVGKQIITSYLTKVANEKIKFILEDESLKVYTNNKKKN